MIARGRLTPDGIDLEPEQPAGLFSCFSVRHCKIRFVDILDIEEQQIDHYLVKYLDRVSKPFRLAQKLIRLAAADRRSASSAGAAAGHPLTDDTDSDEAGSVVERVLARAYAGCHRPKQRLPIFVLINPHSGPGKAARYYAKRAAPIFQAAGLKTKVVTTRYSGHAVKIVRELPLESHDTIVSVSGDGLPHEVLNGLAGRESDSKEALAHFGLAQLPGGSGNAMCNSLNQGVDDWAAAALGIVKGLAEPADIMGISQGRNYFYSFLSQSYGIVADCDLGTEDLRWMGGARFTVGIVWKSLVQNRYPCEIAYEELESSGAQQPAPSPKVDEPVPASWKTETHKDLSMFYAGKMPWVSGDAHVFPRCDPLDGAIDLIVWDNSFGRVRSLLALAKFETGTHVASIPFYKKVRAYRLTPLVENQLLSIDGESYPCAPLQVEVIPGAARFVTPCFQN